jgi:hypothetical protein
MLLSTDREVPGSIPESTRFSEKWGPLSLVRTIEELIERKSSGSGLENREERPWKFVALTTQPSLPAKVGTMFADKRRLLGPYSLLSDQSHGV